MRESTLRKSCGYFGFFHCFYISYVNDYSGDWPMAYTEFYPGEFLTADLKNTPQYIIFTDFLKYRLCH